MRPIFPDTADHEVRRFLTSLLERDVPEWTSIVDRAVQQPAPPRAVKAFERAERILLGRDLHLGPIEREMAAVALDDARQLVLDGLAHLPVRGKCENRNFFLHSPAVRLAWSAVVGLMARDEMEPRDMAALLRPFAWRLSD